jgi:hypothetical protein
MLKSQQCQWMGGREKQTEKNKEEEEKQTKKSKVLYHLWEYSVPNPRFTQVLWFGRIVLTD